MTDGPREPVACRAGPRIGSVELANPLVLAPMAGVTDLAFRILCREAGAGLVCTEMVSDLALLSGSRRSRAILRLSPWEHPVSCQLCGSRPETLADAAVIVAEGGADVVDINMGCPAPKIVSNREGAALMRTPSLAVELVQAVCERLGAAIPVTAKIRAGWDRSGPDAAEFAALLAGAGAAALTVHGRYRDQFYKGRADWSVIRRVKLAVEVPVIGNGDVRSGSDALRMLAETGCDGVMIGRGALGRPEVFSECLAAWLGFQAPSAAAADRAATAVRHLRMLLALKGPERGLVEMRKHCAWYIRGAPGAAAYRDRLMRTEDAQTAEAVLWEALARPSVVEPTGSGTPSPPAPTGLRGRIDT